MPRQLMDGVLHGDDLVGARFQVEPYNEKPVECLFWRDGLGEIRWSKDDRDQGRVIEITRIIEDELKILTESGEVPCHVLRWLPELKDVLEEGKAFTIF